MKAIGLLLFCLCAVFAQQTPNQGPELLRLTDELDDAIRSSDWNKAIALSHSLKDSTVEARNRSLTKGGVELVDQILQWLPPDAETLVIAQQPFKVPSDKPKAIEGVSVMAQGYVLGLFGAIERESIAKVLGGRTVRMAAVGARKFANHTPDARGILPLGLIAYPRMRRVFVRGRSAGVGFSEKG